jgi:hypothetical protein
MACMGQIGFWWGNLMEEPLGRPWRRLEDNIKMDLQDVGWRSMDWIDLVHKREN